MWRRPAGPPWKEYLMDALKHVLHNEGAWVLHPDVPCYTDWEDSEYMKEHNQSTDIGPAITGTGLSAGTCVRLPIPPPPA